MEAQRARAQTTTANYKKRSLQKARRPKPRNRVRYRQCLTPENPARHRKSHRRVAQMHDPHTYPQIQISWFREGGTSHSIGTITTLRQTNKAHPCHRNSTEVIGVIRARKLRRNSAQDLNGFRKGTASAVAEKLTNAGNTVEERRFSAVKPSKLARASAPVVAFCTRNSLSTSSSAVPPRLPRIRL
jgi:hypothetical protein